ncbi:MAG: SUMF1/EgtB/PvdO family nonheme iron enzyme, partial [Flavobacteriaceae bacterium]|nr:SUMF1/EgtB/PvdO family nonheme iron enzyme [Flavobacteriaceae bacterium]
KYVFPPQEPIYQQIYLGALPDTLVWGNKLSRNDIYSEEYFRTPQFDYYPVVGVSWLQAQRYCEWLTDRTNERAAMEKGIINKNIYEQDSYNADGMPSFTAEKYKYNDPALADVINQKKLAQQSGITSKNHRIITANKSSQANLVAKFRLPSEAEWEYAALGEAGDREYNLVQGKDVIANTLRKKKGRNRGMFLENFKYGEGDYSGIGGWPNDGNAITSDVKSYPSNNFGIYGMYGNVAEWVQDVYRPIIDTDGNDFNYYRGNVYSTHISDESGIVKITAETMRYDTLSDGRVVYSSLPGNFRKDMVEDAINFRDGDFQSSLEVGGGREDTSNGLFNFYNAPERRWVVDAGSISAGNTGVLLIKDPKQRTTNISNHTRVIKGGSWNDTVYWLDPGQRRYMDESKAASWLGFRVAQDHRGKESSKNKTKRGVPKK